MNRTVSKLALLFVCLLGMSLTLWGQNSSVVHGIRGYLDPKTGAFHPTPVTEEAQDAPPASSTFAGKFVATFTITVSSTIASTAKLACTFNASLVDAATGDVIEEGAGNAVARGSGSTVTCTVTLPYSWSLASGTTDKVSLSWGIQSPVEFTGATGEFPTRISSRTLPAISVPANGATTTEAIAATI